MMPLNMEMLETCFKNATDNGFVYVAVRVIMEGIPGAEIIINPRENFDAKLAYYKKTYNDDLTHKYAPGKIVGFTFSDSYEEIEDELAY